MFGKIEYWSGHPDHTKGYGFICVRHADGQLDKFFVLGNRILFDRRPQVGDVVEFDITTETPKRDHGYSLVANVRLAKPILPPLHAESELSPLGGAK